MNRRSLIKYLGLTVPAYLLSKQAGASIGGPLAPYTAQGPFTASWESLQQYSVPEWYRNAKFGIWAHWGPQCEPEYGDWYARGMYVEGSDQYKYHLQKYGHPSKFGFKDVIHQWKAEQWDPEQLVSLYKRAGAKYFFAMANHHDNLDLWNSRHHAWNVMNVGPKKDIIGGWAKAARNNGLPFGVSIHAAHAWTWYEVAQRADKNGPLAGVPYDGKLTKADGKGAWWEGLDPQLLYAQNHPLSENSLDNGAVFRQWDWHNGAVPPSKAYCDLFLKRTLDLLDRYEPELVYFDDTVLPLYPVSDVGLQIAAYHYNKSIKRHKGQLQAVLNGKVLNEMQRKCMVWDIERGQSNVIEPFAWQTDTCIGAWHYDKRFFDGKWYKSGKTVIQTLVDVVSKNGNLLLNIPVKGNGAIDDQEKAILEEIAAWMAVNAECIFDTRPWKVLGEGPALENVAPIAAQGFNEGKGKPFGAGDIRFTAKGDSLYAVLLGWPEDGKINIKSLAAGSTLRPEKVNRIDLLGGGEVRFQQHTDALEVTLPENKPAFPYAAVLKIR
ncbi:alpha-L-fucosidase [Chitinophaga oryzae]|uniref:alpha-L-fucosidase n=1 Tax=Chitinophaga oryzae TaxID=2725414 RepID=A0AAE7D772_9BACT|nr:alpha-L-fucosidase [Chitinophaga oryzae]QJB31921.1 alpha-L-fucosidase [Chitinophaga oryzae]QJB38398.1 alpha-L-fucosidase [Chitinophaga oryzae]